MPLTLQGCPSAPTPVVAEACPRPPPPPWLTPQGPLLALARTQEGSFPSLFLVPTGSPAEKAESRADLGQGPRWGREAWASHPSPLAGGGGQPVLSAPISTVPLLSAMHNAKVNSYTAQLGIHKNTSVRQGKEGKKRKKKKTPKVSRFIFRPRLAKRVAQICTDREAGAVVT